MTKPNQTRLPHPRPQMCLDSFLSHPLQCNVHWQHLKSLKKKFTCEGTRLGDRECGKLCYSLCAHSPFSDTSHQRWAGDHGTTSGLFTGAPVNTSDPKALRSTSGSFLPSFCSHTCPLVLSSLTHECFTPKVSTTHLRIWSASCTLPCRFCRIAEANYEAWPDDQERKMLSLAQV